MNKAAQNASIVLGVVSVICAGLGLFYNANSVTTSFSGAFQKLVDEEKLPHFYLAFYTMSAICIACYLILLFCGIEFLRSRVRFVWLFILVLVIEVIYFFGIALLWMLPGPGLSVGAATGVANGGLMFQFLILYPLWGAILAVWTKRRLERIV